MFPQRVCVELFIGATLRHELYLQGYSNPMFVAGFLISVMPALIAWKRKLTWRTLSLILGFLGTALAFTLISQTRVTSEVGLSEIDLQRFFHAPRVLLILAFATAIFHNLPHVAIHAISVSISIILIIYPLALNYYNSFLYINYPSVHGQNLIILTETLEELEKAKQGLPHKEVISGEGVEGWQMYFDISGHLHQKESCFADAHNSALIPSVFWICLQLYVNNQSLFFKAEKTMRRFGSLFHEVKILIPELFKHIIIMVYILVNFKHFKCIFNKPFVTV